jgi:hypothetical protein
VNFADVTNVLTNFNITCSRDAPALGWAADMSRRATPVSIAAVARSLDTPTELAPHLAEVFAPLSSLGGQPRTIVTMLRRAGIGARSRVLDLACGKGAAPGM